MDWAKGENGNSCIDIAWSVVYIMSQMITGGCNLDWSQKKCCVRFKHWSVFVAPSLILSAANLKNVGIVIFTHIHKPADIQVFNDVKK